LRSNSVAISAGGEDALDSASSLERHPARDHFGQEECFACNRGTNTILEPSIERTAQSARGAAQPAFLFAPAVWAAADRPDGMGQLHAGGKDVRSRGVIKPSAVSRQEKIWTH